MNNISHNELNTWIEKHGDMLLVDVLPKESYDKQHIPGSINIPFKNNPEFIQQVENHLNSKAQRVVVYCANAKCDLSKQAASALHEAGLSNVQPFEEGVEGWFKNEKHAA